MINKNDLRKAISSIAISNAKRNTIYKAFSDLDSITKEELDSIKSDISKVVESMLTKDTVGKANGVASLDSNGSVPIEQLGNIDTTLFLIVRELPTTDIKTNKIYLIPNKDDQGNNIYVEYLYVENVWENLGEFKGTGASTAAAVTFDNTASGMTAVTAQAAIDELYEQVQEAKNSGGGLSADAISMLVAILNSAVYISNQSAAIEELRTELKKGGGSSSGVSRPQIVEDYETYMVSITCEDGDAVNIYYTIDGSTPTSSSTLYSGEFSNREDCTIKAIAINKITGKKSTVVTFEYIAKTIDYIEFADPVIEAALLASTNPKIDTNSDGKIQKTEAAAATSLPNFSVNNNIISFDELEYFTGITTTPMFYNCKNFASVKLPKNGALTSICDSFVNSCAITSIDIPEGITSIGTSAFQRCPLSNIVLPSTLTTIGGSAFRETLITEVTIPDSVTTIGGSAFNSCRQLSEIHIGEGVTSIGDTAFYSGYNGRRIYLPSTPPTLGGNGVFSSGGTTTFYVKSQAIKNAYMSIEAWSKYGESNFVIES